ncbi:cytochrome-c peroxidase [Chitinophaga sedimenti]|uniref:cytochrome-c peroxidase n=1 Tax=Chitinophaga sedimenti TaxID=2033606 RepID=UPI002005BD82|nr:cytochrome c peroxidase [Chitinophaga sedimenti]MCK7556885.1 cytochrome-c peroxidase [Chitinophaga sedimenti]
MIRKFIYIVCIFFLVWACRKSDQGGSAPVPYTLQLPDYFPATVYDMSQNPLTREGIALGRRLFYDPRLSRDSTVSCGFCHQQFAAFSHYDHPLSHGVGNNTGTRTVPGLFNLIYQKDFMWDGGVNNLEIQPLTPLTDPNEMGEDLQNVINKIQSNAQYRGMYKAAFGTTEVTTQRTFRALAQFMATMNSFESKYDSIMRKVQGVAFTTEEASGYATFQAKCASCHKEPLFTDGSFRSNGLPYNPALNDVGRMRITNSTGDYLKFKVPSLRNILRSQPYMHDGRFYDIFRVFEHYNKGVEAGANPDPLVKSGIPLSAKEQRELYFFFMTLTDMNFINNKEISEILIED